MRHILSVIALVLCAMGLGACDVPADDGDMARVMAEPRPAQLTGPVLLKSYASIALLPGDTASVYFDVALAEGDDRAVSALTASSKDGSVDVRAIDAINERQLPGAVVTRYRGTISYADCPKGGSTLTQARLMLSDGARISAALGSWCIERRSGKYADVDIYVKHAVSMSARAFREYAIGVSRREGTLQKADVAALALYAPGNEDARTVRDLGTDNVLTLAIEEWPWDVEASSVVTIRPVLLYDTDAAQRAIDVGDSAVFGAPVDDVEVLRAAAKGAAR